VSLLIHCNWHATVTNRMTRTCSVYLLQAVQMQLTGKRSQNTYVPPCTGANTQRRGSGGTDHSVSTAPYDSAASSSRLSVSTNPSSIDARSDRNVQAQYKDIPVPPAPSARPGFLRNSGRTFSLGLGLRSSKDNAAPPASQHDHGPPLPPLPIEPRGRAATASSASTATPPRLFDTDLALDNNEDGFRNMFEGIGTASRDSSPGLHAKRNVRLNFVCVATQPR
jgi:hypothetical protein